jgi:hypothetical protein
VEDVKLLLATSDEYDRACRSAFKRYTFQNAETIALCFTEGCREVELVWQAPVGVESNITSLA